MLTISYVIIFQSLKEVKKRKITRESDLITCIGGQEDASITVQSGIGKSTYSGEDKD